MRTFRCIYVNYFNGLRFLAKISTKFKKILIFRQFKDHNLRVKYGNSTNDPIFYLLFPLYLFVTFIFVFENSQNSFSCSSTFGPFWSVKYLNCGQKLPIRTFNHTFLESRQPEVFKNLYYVLPPKKIQKKVSAHRL